MMSYREYWGCPYCASENIQVRSTGFICSDCCTRFKTLSKYAKPLYGREETVYLIELIRNGREKEAILIRSSRQQCTVTDAQDYIERLKVEYGLRVPVEV